MENWTRKITRLQKVGFREGVVQNPQLRTLCSYISIRMCRSRNGGWGGVSDPSGREYKATEPIIRINRVSTTITQGKYNLLFSCWVTLNKIVN